MLITDPLYVHYIDPELAASHGTRKGHCFMCGAPENSKGCYCRHCNACCRYWLDAERGKEEEQDCAACKVSEETRAAA